MQLHFFNVYRGRGTQLVWTGWARDPVDAVRIASARYGEPHELAAREANPPTLAAGVLRSALSVAKAAIGIEAEPEPVVIDPESPDEYVGGRQTRGWL